jgi:hypothetical protein
MAELLAWPNLPYDKPVIAKWLKSKYTNPE